MLTAIAILQAATIGLLLILLAQKPPSSGDIKELTARLKASGEALAAAVKNQGGKNGNS